MGLMSARGGHLEVGGGQARRRAEGLDAGSGGLEPIVQAQREDRATLASFICRTSESAGFRQLENGHLPGQASLALG